MSRTSCLRYLVDRGELCSDRPRVESRAVPEPPRRPLPATVQRPAGRLLPVQRPGGGLVPSELGAALAISVWGAGLPMQAVVAAGAGGQTLGDVLGISGRASLTGTAAEHTTESVTTQAAGTPPVCSRWRCWSVGRFLPECSDSSQ